MADKSKEDEEKRTKTNDKKIKQKGIWHSK